VRSGATVAFGTDAPVEPIDPWPGLELAVTRCSPDWDAGSPAFGPAEKMTLAEALRAQCTGGPASARDGLRGRLVPGSPADLAVVPSAAFEEPVEPGGPLGRVRPRLVLVDGAVAFEA
jgi:predicted amidohydrolase YtcJ